MKEYYDKELVDYVTNRVYKYHNLYFKLTQGLILGDKLHDALYNEYRGHVACVLTINSRNTKVTTMCAFSDCYGGVALEQNKIAKYLETPFKGVWNNGNEVESITMYRYKLSYQRFVEKTFRQMLELYDLEYFQKYFSNDIVKNSVDMFVRVRVDEYIDVGEINVPTTKEEYIDTIVKIVLAYNKKWE